MKNVIPVDAYARHEKCQIYRYVWKEIAFQNR